MAEKVNENQFDKVGVNPFNAPVPGESLTVSPDSKHSWENPPEYTNDEKALEALYFELTEIDTLRKLINIINDGIPLDEIAQVLLYKGYSEGKYNPDLMLTMIEPTIYLLIAIADYADIKDYILYDGEENDPDAEIHGDDVEPVNWDEDDEDEEIKTDKMAEPKAESLGESLLSRVESELPSKVEQLKGDM